MAMDTRVKFLDSLFQVYSQDAMAMFGALKGQKPIA